MASEPIPKPKKRGKRLGAKHWLKIRDQWIKQNPPNYEGYYQCALGSDMVHVSEVTLDHIITRSQAPNLRYVLSNLQSACALHNFERGSMSMEAWNTRRYKEPPQ